MVTVNEAKGALRAASGLGIEAMALLPAHKPTYGRAWRVEIGGVFTARRSEEVGPFLARVHGIREITRKRGG